MQSAILNIPTRFEKNLAGKPAIKSALTLPDLRGFQNLVGLIVVCVSTLTNENLTTHFLQNLNRNGL